MDGSDDETVLGVVRFPAAVTSPGAARRFVRSAIEGVAAQALVDVAVLLISEGVTNAVMHGDSGTEITVYRSRRGARVVAVDRCPRLPAVAKPDGMREGGRGLVLLDELADGWGAEPVGEG